MKKTRIALAIASTCFATSAFATNGMNMEGYGPISTALGGTAQAYNNGLGGMMNNPATLGMGADKGNKIQIALGNLGPDVSASHTSGVKSDSDGTSYLMPGFGYATKNNGFTWGLGILGQGGMGTEYDKAGTTGLFAGGMSSGGFDSSGGPLATNGTAAPNSPQGQVGLSGKDVRSEVSVGRLVVPFGYEVNKNLNVAASIDYVWAGMDMRMDMDGATFSQLMQGNGGSVGGTMAQSLGNMTRPSTANNGMVAVRDVNYARFDFSNDDNYSGKAQGSGFGGKLGLTWKVNPKLTIGASYHSKTSLSDLDGDATMTMNVDMDPGLAQQQAPQGYTDNTTIDVKGKISVQDFQWPSTYALGVAFKPSESLMLTADVKMINWKDVMKDLKMSFTADEAAGQTGFAQGFGGQTVDISMNQNWDDQVVTMLGAQWKANKNLALRAGANLSNNPVPAETLNPLFPAIVENHYTAGFGYFFNDQSGIDFSLTMAPEVKQTNPNTNITSTHSQTNWQVMYTYRWGVEKKGANF